MNVILLKNCAFNIGFVGIAVSQAVDRSDFIPKCFQKSIRKFSWIKRLLRQTGNCFLYLYCVQVATMSDCYYSVHCSLINLACTGLLIVSCAHWSCYCGLSYKESFFDYTFIPESRKYCITPWASSLISVPEVFIGAASCFSISL